MFLSEMVVLLALVEQDGKSMFLSEMVILMAIAAARDTGKELLIPPMDVIGEYVSYLCDSLVRRGYIKGNNSRGYQFTLKGMEALIEFLHKNRTRFGDTVKMLRQLRIEISREIDKLEKEAIKVK